MLCVVDEDSYDADHIVSKRTQAEESLGAEDDDEETVNNGNSRYTQAFSAASPVLLCRARLQ